MKPPRWRKSSRSGNEGNCVELRSDLAAVRDSKNTRGPVLLVTALEFFLHDVKSGRFDR